MSFYFEVNAAFYEMQTNGRMKRIIQPYMVNAMTFTEAEGKVIQRLEPTYQSQFTVKACRRVNIAEIGKGEGEKWYLVKVGFLIENEKTGSVKRAISPILVRGDDFMEAYENTAETMRGTMADWEVVSLAETPIVDVIEDKVEITCVKREEG